MRSILLSGMWVCLVSIAASAGELTLDEAFARAARLDGQPYALGRSLIERVGKDALPFLTEKAKSAEWRERDLAQALLLRIEQPDQVSLWVDALGGTDTAYTPRDDGATVAKLSQRSADAARASGLPVPASNEVVFTREAVPLLLDLLREWDSEYSLRAVLRLLQRLPAVECVPGLVRLYGTTYGVRADVLDTLVGIGKPAAAPLRDAVRDAAIWKAAGDEPGRPAEAPEVKAQRYVSAMRSAGAALALGRLGDLASAPLLAQKLGEATERHQVEGFATALGQLRAPEAIPVIFSKLDTARRGGGQEPEYSVVREALRSFGGAARDFLRQEAAEGQPLAHRASAAGLLFEIESADEATAFYRAYGHQALAADRMGDLRRPEKKPDPLDVGRDLFWRPYRHAAAEPEGDIPRALLAERGRVFRELRVLLRLARLRGDALAFSVIAESLLDHRRRDRESEKLALALAELGDDQAVEVYRQLLDSDSPRLLESLVEALLLLGSPKAVPVLEEIARVAAEGKPGWSSDRKANFQAAGELARAVLPAFQGDDECLERLLARKEDAVREVAARALARRGDPRAVPELVRVAARSRRDEHAAFRDALVALEHKAVGWLEVIQKESTDWREKLVCEAGALRIARPELAATFEKVARIRHGFYMLHTGPDVGHYKGAGKQMAEAVGEAGIPLLEAAVAFGADPGPIEIPAFALAQFKQERSIPVLVAAFPEARRLRSGNPISVALEEFGEKGIEAAKKIPPPDPAKERYEARASRFRGGTESLAIAQDVQGVENILEALRAPRPKEAAAPYSPAYYAWLQRTQVYLRLAAKCHDDRLVDPVIGLLGETQGSLAREALAVLADYADPRIAPLAVRMLAVQDAREAALGLLGRHLGKRAGPLLIKTLRESKDGAERSGAAWALGRLLQTSSSFWWNAPKEEGEGATATREVALPALVEALKDPSEAVQVSAAEALAETTEGRDRGIRDPRPARPLAEWVAAQKSPPVRVVECLGQTRDPEVAKILLAAYRASGRQNARLAHALGKLHCAEALPDLIQALDERIARTGYDEGLLQQPGGLAELPALGDLGGAGLEKVHAVLRASRALRVQLAAADILGQHGYQTAFPEVQKLFAELLANGVRDPRLSHRGPGELQDQLRGALFTLVGTLASLDRRRAYSLLAAEFLRSDDEALRNTIAHQLGMLEWADPGLRKEPVVRTKKD